jgi:hypothetical protein
MARENSIQYHLHWYFQMKSHIDLKWANQLWLKDLKRLIFRHHNPLNNEESLKELPSMLIVVKKVIDNHFKGIFLI